MLNLVNHSNRWTGANVVVEVDIIGELERLTLSEDAGDSEMCFLLGESACGFQNHSNTVLAHLS